MVPEHAAANVRNRSHTITAYVDVDGSPNGVLLSMGNVLGGFSFFVRDGRLAYVHNFVALSEHRVESPTAIRPGRHRLQMKFEKTGEHKGDVTLLVDDDVVARGEVPRFTPTRFSLVGQGLTCGYSVDCPVCDDYQAPFAFTGLERVVVDVDGEPFVDPEGEAEVAITTQ
jgi:arylsulfatase